MDWASHRTFRAKEMSTVNENNFHDDNLVFYRSVYSYIITPPNKDAVKEKN